ncbi:glycosyltransferase family 4 protein [Desulfobacterales bacterium HSG2]|nr:glycosyltransferase family 4 protein [Desulfobacterales bacterium HSG2]
MDYTLIYYHRIHFPSASGQTIQVLRDYYAMSGKAGIVHILYRSRSPLNEMQTNDSLVDYGAELTPSFRMHCIADGLFGKYRTKRKVIHLTKLSEKTVIIVTRTLDHARDAISIRDKFRSRGVKVILELHETAIPHVIYHEERRNFKAFFSLRNEKKVFHDVDGILCTAPPQLTTLDRIFPNHASAVILPNQYDPSFQSAPKKSRKRGKDAFHIRYAGQFSEWKNTDVMIKALMFLPENIVLDIAGGSLGDEEATEKMLMEKSRKHGVEKRVNYVGFLPPTRVLSFLTDADCLLLPLGDNAQSRLFTSPMKLFEYAASGVPMVVTRQPTTLTLIKEGIHALMADPDSPKELAEAVKSISADNKFAQKLAENAKKWVAQYAPDKRVEKYKEFLLSVVRGR